MAIVAPITIGYLPCQAFERGEKKRRSGDEGVESQREPLARVGVKFLDRQAISHSYDRRNGKAST
jgi:hypothetical protein